MAIEDREVRIHVGVDDQTEKPLLTARQRLSAFERSARKSERQIARMQSNPVRDIANTIASATGSIAQMGRAATSVARITSRIPLRIVDYATAPLRAFAGSVGSTLGSLGLMAGGAGAGYFGAVKPLQLSIDFEQASIGFETMLKGADKAKSFLDELQDFANRTPFEFPQLQKASAMMLGADMAPSNIIPYMRSIGDASAGLGTGAEGIEAITRAIVQMKSKGRVQGDELLQLMEARVPALQMLAAGFNVSTLQMQKMVESGVVPADKAITILIDQMEKRFPNMMDKQSRSLGGLGSTLKDFFNSKLLLSYGQGLSESVKPQLQELVDWFDKNAKTVNEWRDALKGAGRAVGDFVMGGVKNLTNTMTKLVGEDVWKDANAVQKMQLLGDRLITKPLTEWWDKGGGKEAIGGFAQNVAGFLGDVLTASGANGDMTQSIGYRIGSTFIDQFGQAVQDRLSKIDVWRLLWDGVSRSAQQGRLTQSAGPIGFVTQEAWNGGVKSQEEFERAVKGSTESLEEFSRRTQPTIVRGGSSSGVNFSAIRGRASQIPGSADNSIRQGMAMAGAPSDWYDALKIIAYYESTMDPTAVGRTPASNGEFARGLMQMLPSTFDEYAMSGHTDIMDPADNVAAAIRYIREAKDAKGNLKYGTPWNLPGVKSVLEGGPWKEYADGGLITEPVVGVGLETGIGYKLGERGIEEVSPIGNRRGGVSLTINNLTINAGDRDGKSLAREFINEVTNLLGGGLEESHRNSPAQGMAV